MHVKPKLIIRVVTALGKITSTWPCDPHAKNYKKVIKELRWFISLINVVGLLVPLALAAYYNRHSPVLMMKTLSELTALGDVFFNLIICKLQQNRLQVSDQ